MKGEWRGSAGAARREELTEALLIVDALRDPTESSARASWEEMVFRHNPRVRIDPEVLAGRRGARELSRTLAWALADAVDTRWLPALVDHFDAAMAGAELGPGAPSALRVAEAIGALAALTPNANGRPRFRDALAAASGHVRRKAENCAAVITQAMAFDADAPDLPALSMELLRLEGVRMIAESLGDEALAREFAYVSRRVARVALNRAADTVRAFLNDRDMLRFFDNAAVVGRVDDMIVIALRVLDAKVAREEEATAFVQPADQQALEGFVDALAGLADTLTDMVGKMASPKVGTSFFAGLLLQLACVAQFCGRLDHRGRPEKLDFIAARLRSRLARLAGRLGEALDWADPSGPDRPALLARVGELAGALTEMGMRDEARDLIVRLG